MSQRDVEDANLALRNVKEVIDNNRSSAVFETANAFNEEGQHATTEYIPKGPVMDHLKRMD
jgi:hypothetical protein